MKRKSILKLSLLAFICTSCASFTAFSLLFVPNIDSDSLKTNPNLIKEKEVYIDKCQRCHSLINPKYKTRDEWREKVQSYRDDNIINDQEQEAITKYLDWAAK